MRESREKWSRPQLIVLGRGTPEENCLAGCKTSKLASATATKVGCKKTAKSGCSGNKCAVIAKTS